MNRVNLTGSLVERFAFVLALIIPSIIYIPCRQRDFAPVLFVALIGTQCCTVAALIWNEGLFSDILSCFFYLTSIGMIGTRSVAAGICEVPEYSSANDLFAGGYVYHAHCLANV